MSRRGTSCRACSTGSGTCSGADGGRARSLTGGGRRATFRETSCERGGFRVGKTWRGVCALLLLVGGAGGARAEVLTWYYASGPAIVANARQPLVHTAVFTFDTDRLPAGEGLAGRTFRLLDGFDGADSD